MTIDHLLSLDTVQFENKGEVIDLQITDEFKVGLEILEKTDNSLFITGKAGCGKSTLLNLFVKHTNKRTAVLAFTGLAAINVGGETIHSFFKLPLGFLDYTKFNNKREKLKQKLNSVDVIVIDEISMVRADMIDAMDKMLKVHRDSQKPFGGVQMIFMGDLHQLPPIIDKEMGKVYYQEYKTPFFFSAHLFREYKLPYLNLAKIFRQKDQKFIDALNSVRERNSNLFPSLEVINENILRDKVALAKQMIRDETVCITTTNKKSKQINDYFLSKLKTKDFTFHAKIKGDFDEKSYPTEEKLVLRLGAKVMAIRNDVNKFYVNGDIGIVTHLDHEKIRVKFRDNEVFIDKATWEKYVYEKVEKETDDEDENGNKKYTLEKKVTGEFIQFPLKLAWSVTIHKAQGQTYNKVFIDFGNGTFTSGQAYVALSRCRSLEGMMLNQEIQVTDVKLDESIGEFYKMFQNVMEM